MDNSLASLCERCVCFKLQLQRIAWFTIAHGVGLQFILPSSSLFSRFSHFHSIFLSVSICPRLFLFLFSLLLLVLLFFTCNTFSNILESHSFHRHIYPLVMSLSETLPRWAKGRDCQKYCLVRSRWWFKRWFVRKNTPHHMTSQTLTWCLVSKPFARLDHFSSFEVIWLK